MTDDKDALRELLAKGSDATFLREMIGFAAQRLMELEVGAVTGAAHGERSPERLVQRNGHRDRDWETRAGTVELRCSLRRPETAKAQPGSDQTANAPVVLFHDVVSGHALGRRHRRSWERPPAGCILGSPGQGRREHVEWAGRDIS
jgi:hypothetical protein